MVSGHACTGAVCFQAKEDCTTNRTGHPNACTHNERIGGTSRHQAFCGTYFGSQQRSFPVSWR
eukprot:9903777-Karenia_brevis.AAC.1